MFSFVIMSECAYHNFDCSRRERERERDCDINSCDVWLLNRQHKFHKNYNKRSSVWGGPPTLINVRNRSKAEDFSNLFPLATQLKLKRLPRQNKYQKYHCSYQLESEETNLNKTIILPFRGKNEEVWLQWKSFHCYANLIVHLAKISRTESCY